MTALAIVAIVMAVGLVVVAARSRRRERAAEAETAALQVQWSEALDDVAEQTAAAATARRERDDALERVDRTRRDAAEVANRLHAESTARSEVEADRDRLREQVSDLGEQVEELRRVRDAAVDAAAAAAGGERGGLGEQLWALEAAGLRRTWEVSVAPVPGMVCPLDEAGPRAAEIGAQILLDAAREDIGIDVELDWQGSPITDPARAAVTVSLIRELVAAVGHEAEEATISVVVAEAEIEVRVDALGAAGEAVEVRGLSGWGAVADGVYRIRGVRPDRSVCE